jgi:hypothetical protein
MSWSPRPGSTTRRVVPRPTRDPVLGQTWALQHGRVARPQSESPATAAEPTQEHGDVNQARGRDGLTAQERETIRAWAANEGIEVKARGILKKDLIANYEAWSARQA